MNTEISNQKYPDEQSKGLRVAGQSIAGVVLGFTCVAFILGIVVAAIGGAVGGVIGGSTASGVFTGLGVVGIILSLALLITISVFFGKINAGSEVNYMGFGIAILVMSIVTGILALIVSFDGWIILVLGIIAGSLLIAYASKNNEQ